MPRHQVTSELIMLNNNNVHVFNCDLKISCGGNSLPQLIGGDARGEGGVWVFVTHMLAHVLCAYTGISLRTAKKSNLRNAVIR